MESASSQLLDTALHLPRHDRALMAERLLESLDDNGAALSPEWQAEIDRRIVEIDCGDAKLVPAEDVFRDAFAALS